MLRGPDWTMFDDGTIKLNYGGYKEPPWEPWKEKFCWLPTKITVIIYVDDEPSRPYMDCCKVVWLKKIYVRRRLLTHYPKNNYEYQYLDNIFDMIKLESKDT